MWNTWNDLKNKTVNKAATIGSFAKGIAKEVPQCYSYRDSPSSSFSSPMLTLEVQVMQKMRAMMSLPTLSTNG